VHLATTRTPAPRNLSCWHAGAVAYAQFEDLIQSTDLEGLGLKWPICPFTSATSSPRSRTSPITGWNRQVCRACSPMHSTCISDDPTDLALHVHLETRDAPQQTGFETSNPPTALDRPVPQGQIPNR
jgi:hypothetical protein